MSNPESDTITSLTPEDKKLLMRGYTLDFYKPFHIGLLVSLLIALLIVYFNYNQPQNFWSVFGLFSWMLVVFNAMFLVDFLVHKFQILNKDKIVIHGKVTDKYESGSEHGGTIIVVNNEKFDTTWIQKIDAIEINDAVEMHFIYSKKNKRGHVFRIQKVVN